MSGYNGYSMSINAVSAYNDGEMPLSKWTKSEIISTIEDAVVVGSVRLKCSIDKLKSVPVKLLKDICLYNSSWHHTSKHYNVTDFYAIDFFKIEELTDEEIDRIVSDYKKDQLVKEVEKEEKWLCEYLEWGGTRKHPKATVHQSEGVIKGNWFILPNGSKKKTTANGFKKIKKIE